MKPAPRSNEEEVKVKLVIPLLSELGFDTTRDLEFETALGPIPEAGKKSTFADIIVKLHGDAVLLIETKSERVSVRSRDAIEQAINYALHYRTVIPYAVVSNGRDLVLIDVLQKRIIEREDRPGGLELDNLLRLQAQRKERTLRLLRPPSIGELKLVADGQRAREMALLRGTDDDSTIVDRKYRTDLYVARPAITSHFEAFIANKDLVFALVGDAGMGKTNFLCAMAERLGVEDIVFFYNGLDLVGSLLTPLASDLTPCFPAVQPHDVLGRTAELLAESGRRGYIFVDALNECAAGREALQTELNAIASAIESLPWRLVVSCRTLDWDFWLRRERHMRGHLARATFSGLRGSGPVGVGTTIGEWEDDEFRDAWERYRTTYGLRGNLSPGMARLCREPFMLRLVAEVYGQRGAIPEYIQPAELFRRYIDEKFPSDAARLATDRLLFWLARTMIQTQTPRAHTSDVPAADVPACRQLINENVLIFRRGDYLFFHFELFLEFVMAEHLLSEFAAVTSAEDSLQRLRELTDSQLVNMPGAIENLLVGWRDEPSRLVPALDLLAGLTDTWAAIACSVLRRWEGSLDALEGVIVRLACRNNYVIRLFLSQALGRFSDSTRWRIVSNLGNKGDSWEARETAANIVGHSPALSHESIDVLSQLMDDVHWRVRRAAGYSLQSYLRGRAPSDDQHVAQLVAEIDACSWRMKYSLAIALLGADLDEHSPVSAAVNLLAKDANPQVRWAVANYLPRYSGDARELLVELLRADDDAWVRAKMVDALISLEGLDSTVILASLSLLAQDTVPSVRVCLARRLVSLTNKAMAKSLVHQLMYDDVADVAYASLYTWSALGYDTEVLASMLPADPRQALFFKYRERIARREIEVQTSRFSLIQDYISRRTEFAGRNDPYMTVIDTICSLIGEATRAISKSGGSVPEFLDFVRQDADEAVRWALVVFVSEFADREIDQEQSLSILRTLSSDPHWWIRREVASSLRHYTALRSTRFQAISIAEDIRLAEFTSSEPCKDEVLYFVDSTLSYLRALN